MFKQPDSLQESFDYLRVFIPIVLIASALYISYDATTLVLLVLFYWQALETPNAETTISFYIGLVGAVVTRYFLFPSFSLGIAAFTFLMGLGGVYKEGIEREFKMTNTANISKARSLLGRIFSTLEQFVVMIPSHVEESLTIEGMNNIVQYFVDTCDAKKVFDKLTKEEWNSLFREIITQYSGRGVSVNVPLNNNNANASSSTATSINPPTSFRLFGSGDGSDGEEEKKRSPPIRSKTRCESDEQAWAAIHKIFLLKLQHSNNSRSNNTESDSKYNLVTLQSKDILHAAVHPDRFLQLLIDEMYELYVSGSGWVTQTQLAENAKIKRYKDNITSEVSVGTGLQTLSDRGFITRYLFSGSNEYVYRLFYEYSLLSGNNINQ